jgi:sodium transport system ATP-binding protein
LKKHYGRIAAVEDISLVAGNGVVTGLLGPNGAGKTTIIRMLVGLSRPDAGRVIVDDIDVARDPSAARARLGVLPESAGLYDRLTVREHLAFSGELHGMAAPDLDASVAALLTQLDLVSIADRPAGQLSLGQARRVALGRALVHGPANLILDEPTNGLDVLSAREVRRVIRRLADAGCAVLFSSHQMPEVSALCDRIAILSRGWLIAVDTPSNILERAKAWTLEEAFIHLIGSEEGLQ